MCGIVGKLYFSDTRRVDPSLVKKMADIIKYRGPDDEGYYCHGQIGLGHRRLSIIDLSPAGHQPMSNADATVWIVYNGEIYNFKDLQIKLQKLGYNFKSHSDTEVIIHLYEEYGEDCVEYLRGMFAFAIWDAKKRKLFMARDRVGKKPLKYYLNKDFIIFGSELKTFFIDPEVPKEIDYQAIHHYLALQYVPHPLTGFKDIQKLEPGHFLSVDLSQQKTIIKCQRYWNLDFSKKLHVHENELHQEILKRFEEAVKIRMVADVPIGAFLSGGVDSSAVVAMMAKCSSKPIKTFSIGFKQATHNELQKARIIAKYFATEHMEFIVEPKAIELLPKLVYHYEEPYADSSAIPTYYVAQETRQHVTVALNGDGGDENFAGYPWYKYQKLAALLDTMPASHIFKLFKLGLLKTIAKPRSTFSRRANIFCNSQSLPEAERYMSYFTSSYFTEKEKLKLYEDEFLKKIEISSTRKVLAKIYLGSGSNSSLDSALYSDINSYLPDDLLVKVDIAAMANSLEARSPFLDHQFMEFAAQIPANQKMRGFKLKQLLKKALAEVLPREILNSPKHGFTVPLGDWFRKELFVFAKQELLSSNAKIKSLIKQNSIQAILDEHRAGKIDHGSRIWSLLTLEFWLKTFHNSQKA